MSIDVHFFFFLKVAWHLGFEVEHQTEFVKHIDFAGRWYVSGNCTGYTHTQISILHKIKARANIDGNEQAHTRAKRGRELDYIDAATPYEHAHPTPYCFQKGWWHSMQETLDKGPIRHLGKHILKHDNKHNLAIIANQTYQWHKWLKNDDIDKILSSDF